MEEQLRDYNTTLNLLIIAKTTFGEKHCYLGLDMFSERILRPIPSTNPNEYFWSPKEYEFHIGELHSFEVISYGPEEIEFPHRGNDVHVSYLSQCSNGYEDLYTILYPQAEENMEDVFAGVEHFVSPDAVYTIMVDVMEEGKYVAVNENCPSCGILRCKGSDISIYERKVNKNMRKFCNIVNFGREFDLPVTAINHDSSLPNDDILVILGLARPFTGRDCKYYPRRCYILVVGIVIKH